MAEIVERHADGLWNCRIHCVTHRVSDAEHSTDVGIYHIRSISIRDKIHLLDVLGKFVDTASINYQQELDPLCRGKGKASYVIDWLIEEGGISSNNTEVQNIAAVTKIDAIDGLLATRHKSHVSEDCIKLTI